MGRFQPAIQSVTIIGGGPMGRALAGALIKSIEPVAITVVESEPSPALKALEGLDLRIVETAAGALVNEPGLVLLALELPRLLAEGWGMAGLCSGRVVVSATPGAPIGVLRHMYCGALGLFRVVLDAGSGGVLLHAAEDAPSRHKQAVEALFAGAAPVSWLGSDRELDAALFRTMAEGRAAGFRSSGLPDSAWLATGRSRVGEGT